MALVIDLLAVHALNSVVDQVVRDRWSLSVEMLTTLHEKLVIAASLLQETLNSRCVINNLPSEILALVFSMVPSALSPTGAPGPSSATQTYDILPITHVCRYWRELALSTPSLWSTICETKAGHVATRTLHERAKQAALVIYVDRSRPTVALTELLPRSVNHSRVTELHLHDLHDLLPSEISGELLAFPAPKLERVVVRRRVGRGATVATEEPAEPMAELFSGVTPKLRSLVLHDVPFLPSNRLESLTHLRLSFEVSPIYWTLPDLLQLLSRTPALEDARFIGLPMSLQASYTPAMPSVSLPSLRRLEVGECRGQGNPTALMRAVFSHLVLPSTCAIRLYGVCALRLSPLTDLRTSVIDRPTSLSIDVTFTTLTLTASNATSLSGKSLRMELNTAGASKRLLQESVEGFVTGHAADISNVTVTSQRAWPSWCDPNLLLSILPNMSSLSLCDTSLVDQCLDALRPCCPPLAEETSHPACPHLKSLHLPSGISDVLVQKVRSILAERAMSHLECVEVDSCV